jgi:Ca2+/Na+ antiporter
MWVYCRLQEDGVELPAGAGKRVHIHFMLGSCMTMLLFSIPNHLQKPKTILLLAPFCLCLCWVGPSAHTLLPRQGSILEL